jgi:photosystem II stability/assembly factor-like uncharacterized protein
MNAWRTISMTSESNERPARRKPCTERNRARRVPIRVVAIMLLVFSVSSHAQWEQLNLYGGDVRGLTASGTHMFCGVNQGGLYRRALQGGVWERTCVGLPNCSMNIEQMLYAKGTIMALAQAYGPFLSSDNGGTWVQPLNFVQGNYFSIAGSDHALYYAGVVALFMIPDVNATPVRLSLPPAATQIFDIAASGNALYLATDQGVHVTSTDGATWTQISTKADAYKIAVDGNIVVASSTLEIQISTDGGTAWYGSATAISSIAISGNVIYGAKNGTVVRSTDMGTTWSGYPELASAVLCLLPREEGLYVGTFGGIHLARVLTGPWEDQLEGLRHSYVYETIEHKGNIYASTAWKTCRSADRGEHWTVLHVAGPCKSAGSSTTLYLLSDDSLYRSTDAGDTLLATQPSIAGQYRYTKLFWSEGVLYVGLSQYPTLMASTDEGTTWYESNNGLGSRSSIIDIWKHGSDLYASVGLSTSTAGIYLSTDAGDSWTRILYKDMQDAHTSAGQFMVVAGRKGLARTSDKGATWQFGQCHGLTEYNGGGVYGFTSLTYAGGTLVAGMLDGVWFSSDLGDTWCSANTGFPTDDMDQPMALVTCLLAKDGLLFAGTSGLSIWRRPLREIVLDASGVPAPTGADLISNYPNPFSAKTDITLKFAASSKVELEISDVSGRVVDRMYLGFLSSGTHLIPWDGSRHAPGRYYLFVKAEGRVYTRPIQILR